MFVNVLAFFWFALLFWRCYAKEGGKREGEEKEKRKKKRGKKEKEEEEKKKRYKENDIHTFLNATIYLSPSSPNAIEVKLYVMHVSCVTERWFASIISK